MNACVQGPDTAVPVSEGISAETNKQACSAFPSKQEGSMSENFFAPVHTTSPLQQGNGTTPVGDPAGETSLCPTFPSNQTGCNLPLRSSSSREFCPEYPVQRKCQNLLCMDDGPQCSTQHVESPSLAPCRCSKTAH